MTDNDVMTIVLTAIYVSIALFAQYRLTRAYVDVNGKPLAPIYQALIGAFWPVTWMVPSMVVGVFNIIQWVRLWKMGRTRTDTLDIRKPTDTLVPSVWKETEVTTLRQEHSALLELNKELEKTNSILAEQNTQLWTENVRLRDRQSVLASPALLNKIEEFIELSDKKADEMRRFAIFQTRNTNQLDDPLGLPSEVEEDFELSSNRKFLIDVEQRLRLNSKDGENGAN